MRIFKDIEGLSAEQIQRMIVAHDNIIDLGLRENAFDKDAAATHSEILANIIDKMGKPDV